jgi:hypothetical protein
VTRAIFLRTRKLKSYTNTRFPMPHDGANRLRRGLIGKLDVLAGRDLPKVI